MLIRTMTTLTMAALLVACGSGATPPIPPLNQFEFEAAPPSSGGTQFIHFEGVWHGSITPEDTMTTVPALAIVNGWGEMRLLMGGVQFVGWPRRTSAGIEGNLTGIHAPGSSWSDGSQASEFRIEGAIDTDNVITATYVGSMGGGAMVLWPVPGSLSSYIAATRGTWVLLDEDHNYVATFDFDPVHKWEASLYGTHANGCIYSGSIESWTSVNSFDLSTLEVSSCPPVDGVDMNGTYSGSAVRVDLADDGTDELVLVIALSYETTQLTYYLYRP